MNAMRNKQHDKSELLKNIRKIHMVGIGGAGMGGIAEILHQLGYSVAGSDMKANYLTDRLQQLGVEVRLNHAAANIRDAELLVVTSAVNKNNPEWQEATAKQIPILGRGEMLAELMSLSQGIAVSGTHGKTTTSGLLTAIFLAAEKDPTFVIGGKLKGINLHAKLGKGDYFIAEVDESDGSFLYFKPKYTIVTNIDRDHMQTYGHDEQRLYQAFRKFLENTAPEGLIAVSADDAKLWELTAGLASKVLSYGFNAKADLQILEYRKNKLQSEFTVRQANYPDQTFTLNLPGKHNVSNAAACILIARSVGISDEIINHALSSFAGTGRRFQCSEIKIGANDCIMVDDYGHHPREIMATLDAVRGCWPDRRLVLAYQPHRYTRTRELFDDFIDVLSKSDYLVLLPIYAASEQPIQGCGSEELYQAIQKVNPQLCCLEHEGDLESTLQSVIQDDDIVLLQGAGSIGEIAEKLAVKYARK